MIERVIRWSIAHRALVLCLCAIVAALGIRALYLLPIDAVPDVTNRQVQINLKASGLGPEEMERRVTFPVELALGGLPRLQEVRSISQFGLSQVTVVFEEDVDIYAARQWVNERIQEARDSLPPGVTPELSPISTGLGEIYYLRIDNPRLDLMEKRTLLDWTVRPLLRGVKGLAEVNTWGGTVRQYQVRVDPNRLQAFGLTFRDIVEAVSQSNANAGGGTITRGGEQRNVRTVGTLTSLSDIADTVVKAQNGVGVTVGQLAQVVEGPMQRQGAITRDGVGEDAVAITMLLMGENGRLVVQRVKDRVAQIESALPAGSRLVGFLDRSDLIHRTLTTALQNLSEGGLLVVLLLFLFLGQMRAGLIVSSAIPLSMLICVIGMYRYKVSANLMSLGALDFGLIVDGSVIIVENCVRRLAGRTHLTEEERLEMIAQATIEVRSATQFGEMIIIASYLPILSLQGLEGKMFRPMGFTVVLALLGAMLLSFTVTPALCAFFLKPALESKESLLTRLKDIYGDLLSWCFGQWKFVFLSSICLMLLVPLGLARLGGEFIPELDEGAIAVQAVYLPGTSLESVVERSIAMEKVLRSQFGDEVESTMSRIGRPEIATDPMQVFQVDLLISLKPISQWKKARTRSQLVVELDKELSKAPGVSLSFSQPIKMRMMELIEGVGIRSDLGVKLFGEDREILESKAQQAAQIIRSVRGAADVSVETTTGLPQLDLEIDRVKAAQLGVRVDEINQIVEAALGGKTVTEVNDGSKRISVAVMLPPDIRSDPSRFAALQVPTQQGLLVPLSAVCRMKEVLGPAQISREGGLRRVVIQANVRDRDLASFVDEVRGRLEKGLQLAPGYYLQYGGTYEKMQSGRARLALIVPVTCGLILSLLFVSFGSVSDAALVFLSVPLAACGGVLALWLRGMTLSISACIGFIALGGVAVLNGVVLLHFIRDLHARGQEPRKAALRGSRERLRPVLMTAAVAGFGFLPMALSSGAGAEVQKPLATVVIGGLVSSTTLTLLVLPTLWLKFRRKPRKSAPRPPAWEEEEP
ncbi:efflux RND transporter permease subunit [bacterium]|nr:efflux RND transporter permease subunit [bacterium]